ncbi:MAG: phage holin family protein [Puniceicoccales bacterium]|jgi:putative membrane protein|nr:phage holin family protein [Puniceicoccales bacterium]
MNESKSWGRWIREWVAIALGVLTAAHIVPGITYDNTGTLLLVTAVLSLLNSLARPFLQSLFVLVALPLVLLTFGLAVVLVLWVVNSLLLYFTSLLIEGFKVATFGDALWGALCISAVSWLLPLLVGDGGKGPRPPNGTGAAKTQRHRLDDDDVIDV